MIAIQLFLGVAAVTFGVPWLIERVVLLLGESLIFDPDQHRDNETL